MDLNIGTALWLAARGVGVEAHVVEGGGEFAQPLRAFTEAKRSEGDAQPPAAQSGAQCAFCRLVAKPKCSNFAWS